MTQNKHEGHRASCLCCIHLELALGAVHYSDVTPGDCGEVYCGRERFPAMGPDADFLDLRVLHDAVDKCPDFRGRPAPEVKP